MFFASASSGAQLTCHPPNFICPASSVSCECQGLIRLAWRVRLVPDSEPLFSHHFIASTGMNESSSNGFTAILCNVTEDPLPGLDIVINTKLTFMFMENVTVECEDNSGSATAILQGASRSLT